MVDPARPQYDYSGAERQEWNRLHDQEMAARQRPAVSSGGGGVDHSSANISGGISSGGGGSRGGGGGVIGNAVGGAVGGLVGVSGALGEKSAKMSFWFVEKIWPLKALADLGQAIAGAGWKARLVTAIPAALAGAGVALNQGGQDPVLGTVGLAVGAALGWAVPTLLGFALTFGAVLVGLAIGLGLIAAALGLAYLAITALAH